MSDFQERVNNFQVDFEKLQKKYDLQVYSAQVVLSNGEIANLIKLRDLAPPEAMIDLTKKYDGNAKKGYPTNKKA